MKRGARALLVALLWGQAAPVARAQEPPAVVPKGDLPDGPPKVKVTDQGMVQMHVSGLPLVQVLHQLSLESRRNIIASPKVGGSVTASLYDVTFKEALDSILIPNGAAYVESGKFIYVYTREELAQRDLDANPPVTRVFALSYINSVDAGKYITPLLGEGGLVTASPAAQAGIGSAPDEGGGQSSAAHEFIVVSARPANLERVARLLKEVDVRPRQVLIEATLLRAKLEDENALGVDFNVVGGVDLELLGATSNALQDVTLGELPQARLEKFNAAGATEFRGNVPNGGLSIGIIKDNVAAFVRALESVTDTVVLANPKVLVLNKQRGQVIVGRRDGYLTTTVTETQAIQSVEFLETGTQLIFRPYIGEDGYVRIELHPEDSVGVVSAQGLPSEQTTEVTTNVLVKDGHTVMIGGLFREVSTDARSQVPGLGNIPFAGQLFRSNNDTTEREEVIVLLTVHVVKDNERYAEASAEQLADMERMRVGLRQGLMWHGRERRAQSYYHKAVENYAAGDTKWARWNVNLALHCYPRLLPAIELREKITGDHRWEEDSSPIRGFLYDVMARQKGVEAPILGRPVPPFIGPEEPHGPSGYENADD